MKPSGNTKLVDYGIQNENSQVRIHVCPVVKRVYVYETKHGVKAVKSGQYRPRQVRTGDYVTAIGYAVPVDDIESCQCFDVPDETWEIAGFDSNDNQTRKGEKAERLVELLLASNMISLPTSVDCAEEKEQIEGTDLVLHEITVQVKCNYRGGHRELGGTGNLFIQVSECNPYKLGAHHKEVVRAVT